MVVTMVVIVGLSSLLLYALWKFTLLPLVRYKTFLTLEGVCAPYWFPPPIGHLFQLPQDSEGAIDLIIRWCRELKGGIPYFWLGPQPIIVVNTAQLAEQILFNPELGTKGFLYEFLQPWLQTGLLTSGREKWRFRRKLLTPAFHFAILKTYFTIIQRQTLVLIDVINELNSEELAVDIRDVIANYTLDVICETAMGVYPNAQRQGKGNVYVKAVKDSNELLVQRMTLPYLWSDFLYDLTSSGRKFRTHLKVLHDFTAKTIAARQTERKLAAKVYTDKAENDVYAERNYLPFLDLLLNSLEKDGNGIGVDVGGVQEEVDTFMFEGHDTIATALLWTIQCLGVAPDIQHKVQMEVDSMFKSLEGEMEEGSNQHFRKVSFEDVSKSNYLDKVIKEAMRLFPPVPVIQRRVDRDTVVKVNSRNVTLPKGIQIDIIPYLLHRDPQIFPDPECFNPDRFDVESNKNRHPCAYIPFSAGSRNCIGQRFAMIEAKIALIEILKRFTIVALQTTESIGTRPDLILRPRRPVKIKFIPRSQKT